VHRHGGLQEELRLGGARLLHPGQQRLHHHQRAARAHRQVLRRDRRHYHGLPGAGQDIQVGRTRAREASENFRDATTLLFLLLGK